MVMENFFFQAEDGIRDLTVTGVQTCALPISGGARRSTTGRSWPGGWRGCWRVWCARRCDPGRAPPALRGRCARSEERRVGKEGRSRWSAYDKKKKKVSKTPQQPLRVYFTDAN